MAFLPTPHDAAMRTFGVLSLLAGVASVTSLQMSATLPASGAAARVGGAYDRLSGATLTAASTSQPVAVGSLWSAEEGETCVVEFLRHFG